MAEADIPNTDTQVAEKLPFWRWLDDDYIAQGKVSGLAIIEIFAAMLFYWFIANYFERPWVLVLSVCIAPILLLRSEASIQFGIKLLKKSMGGRDLTIRQLWLIGILVFVSCFYLTHFLFNWLAFKWLVGHAGWAIVWRVGFLLVAAGAIGAFIGSLIFAPAFAAGFSVGMLGAVVIPLGALAGATSVCVALMGYVSVTLLISAALAILLGALFFKKLDLPPVLLILFFIPGLVTGMCLIAWFFRFCATTAHLSKGVNAFSMNWRETVLVTDIRHASSLLPSARKVSSGYYLATLFNVNGEIHKNVYFGKLFMGAIYTFVATLYRWNIKASTLIWAPIALGLSPTNWRNYTEMREQSSLSSEKWLFYTSVGFLVALTTLLIAIPNSLSDFIASLPKWMESKTVISFIPQQNTLRYGLLCLFSLSFAVQLFLAWRMRTQHDKPLSSAADFKPYFEDAKLKDDLDSFSRQANQLHRLLKINTAIAIFTVWAFALKFALDKWPNELQNVVWDWLKPMI